MAKFLVLQLALEDYVVATVYLVQGDFARFVYWLAAGTITSSTLFFGRGA